MSAAFEPVATEQTGTGTVSDVPMTAGGPVRVGGSGIALLGLLTMLTAAWGGIVPFVGPTFGYSADGAGSWYWNLAHALLAVVPGAVGVVAGYLLLTAASRVRLGLGRGGMAMAGVLAILAGAWFVVGPFAWPVLEPRNFYLAPASPLTTLLHEIGYAFGPGVLLTMFGAYSIGWGARHRNPVLIATGSGIPRHLASVRQGSIVEPTGQVI